MRAAQIRLSGGSSPPTRASSSRMIASSVRPSISTGSRHGWPVRASTAFGYTSYARGPIRSRVWSMSQRTRMAAGLTGASRAARRSSPPPALGTHGVGQQSQDAGQADGVLRGRQPVAGSRDALRVAELHRRAELVPPPVIMVTFERTCIPDRGVARRLRTFQVRGALRALRSGAGCALYVTVLPVGSTTH